MSNSRTTKTAETNIKDATKIQTYIDTYKNDFKQVFFKPQASQIKSHSAGVFVKDIYGKEQVTPIAQIPGYHTSDSCLLNTAIYANSTIDYNSPTNYVPGVKEVKVDGDFANSSNYFLTASPSATFGPIFSIEISGYIATKTPGTYNVSTDAQSFFKKNALIWIGNNALKTYRKENAKFVVENGVLKNNYTFGMVTDEYTPFRIQYSGDVSFDYKTQKLWVNPKGEPISTFATNENENNLYYYSLSPSNEVGYYNCHVYNGSDLQKYKSDAKQQITLVWQTPLDDNTAYVFLDMIGNLYAYDSKYEKIGEPIYKSKGLTEKKPPYKLELNENNLQEQPLCIRDPKNNVIPITPKINNLNALRNSEWEKEKNPMVKFITNEEEQVGDKSISKNRISETNPLYSVNFQYKLCIIKDSKNKKILALLASTKVLSKFYTAEPDLKMNKLFYARTNKKHKILREVPANLQVSVNTYATYLHTYPVPTNKYTETSDSETNNCETQCKAQGMSCNHFYKVVTNSSETKCLISSESVTTYLPKQPSSTYKSSTLNIKNKVIQTEDASKNQIYNQTTYISNGYNDKKNQNFSNYPVQQHVLSASDMPGPYGTQYVVNLQNKISKSTNGTTPFSTTNINQPMIAGKIENFTVAQDSLTKLNKIDTQFKQYKTDQYTVQKNRVNIRNKVTSIDKTYKKMAKQNIKYDFTGEKIYALEEDRTLASALIKDNAIFKQEQNNLYMFTTLTVATLLVTAVLISK